MFKNLIKEEEISKKNIIIDVKYNIIFYYRKKKIIIMNLKKI